ncbi:MAG: YihA family ribosome biogenesis GTP-binding protein [Erysipelotrichaceae bacterium]|nr:YihA family ribosome biogenesis GTP-binding protein [Erysipelotrichaceae bacterium]
MISFICSAKDRSGFPQTEKEVVFVGRSNVGKSSLINTLYKKKLAYVGKTPGKTKLINFFDIDGRYTAVDVPGYGYAKRSMEEAVQFGRMMDDYFARKDKIALVIMITDVRIGLTADDEDMKGFLDSHELPYVIIANKTDKLSNNQLMNSRHKLYKDMDNVIYVSAEKRRNIDQIYEAIDLHLPYSEG